MNSDGISRTDVCVRAKISDDIKMITMIPEEYLTDKNALSEWLRNWASFTELLETEIELSVLGDSDEVLLIEELTARVTVD